MVFGKTEESRGLAMKDKNIYKVEKQEESFVLLDSPPREMEIKTKINK